MNDPNPSPRYVVRSEDRTEVTYLDDPNWNALVHKLIHAIDAGFERSGQRLEVLEKKSQHLKNVNAKRKADRQSGIEAAKAKIEARRQAIIAALQADPFMTVADTAKQFSVSETFVREIRRAQCMPHLNGRKDLKAKLVALLVKSPELENEDIAARIGTTAGYVRKLRRRLGMPTRGIGAAKA